MTTTVVNINAPGVREALAAGDPRYILIDRTTKWGNPYRIGSNGTREEVVRKHRELIPQQPGFAAAIRRELAGKILVCHCKPLLCHGDNYAEAIEGERRITMSEKRNPMNPDPDAKMQSENLELSTFRTGLERLINRCSQEKGSNTPDFILAAFMASCLSVFDAAVRRRDEWYGICHNTVKENP